MRLMNEREQVRNALVIWRKQHPREKKITTQLQNLDVETATAKDVELIVGSNILVRELSCDECGYDTWDIIGIGGNHSEYDVYICRDCLVTAYIKIGEERCNCWRT